MSRRPAVQGDGATLEALRDRIAPLVAPGGELVLSGILREQANEVMDAYAGELQFEPPREQDGWVLLHARRPG